MFFYINTKRLNLQRFRIDRKGKRKTEVGDVLISKFTHLHLHHRRRLLLIRHHRHRRLRILVSSCMQSFPKINEKCVIGVSVGNYEYWDVMKFTLSYRALSFSAIASYFDFVSGSASAQRRPNSFATSPTPYSGLIAFTFGLSSLQYQKKADLKIEHLIFASNEKKKSTKRNTYSDLFGAFGSLMCFLFLPLFSALEGT